MIPRTLRWVGDRFHDLADLSVMLGMAIHGFLDEAVGE